MFEQKTLASPYKLLCSELKNQTRELFLSFLLLEPTNVEYKLRLTYVLHVAKVLGQNISGATSTRRATWFYALYNGLFI